VLHSYPEVCFRRDDPIADIAGPSYLAVMRLARSKGVPVMLMGQGGDEFFWGYSWVARSVAETERKRRLRNHAAGLGSYLSIRKPPLSYVHGMKWLRDGGGILDGIRRWRHDRSSDPDRLVFYDRATNYEIAEALLPSAATSGFLERTRHTDPATIFTGRGLWDRVDISITRLIAQTYLLCNGINQGDRLSMATSVEARLPLVDYRLVETVIGLRKAQPDHMLAPKAWLIGAMRDLVPQFVFERRKRGFSPPWREWARSLFAAYGGDLADGILASRGILRREALATMIRGVSSIGTPEPLANEALALEQWCRGMAAASAAACKRSRHENRACPRTA
jgi:asparagine synthase (glutamine-hydrolysing)